MARADLETFAATQIHSSRRVASRAAPPAARCFEITAVEPGSVGERLGLRSGDFLTSLNGQSASVLQPKLWRVPGRIREYVFFSTASGERIEATTTGIDPGLELRRTPDLVKATYKPGSRDPEALMGLWEAGAWSTLLPLAEGALKSGPPDTPILALYAATLWHVGRKDEAVELAMRYAQQYARGWIMEYLSVATHVIALSAAASGRADAAVEMLRAAYKNAPMERIADAIERLGAPRPTPPVLWTGRAAASDYALPRVDDAAGSALVSFAAMLEAVAPGRLALVCLLDGYRGNGPYNEFMKRYRSYARDFKPWIGPLHVITEKRPRPEDRPYYFEAEDKAREEKAPFEVLFDAEGAVGAAYSPNGSPFVIALDRDGRIHAEGEMEGPAVWRALRAANP